MNWLTSDERKSPIELAQAVLQSRASIHLDPVDIALLILIRSEIDSRAQGTISVSMDVMRGLLARIDRIDSRDPKSAERRLLESLGRLKSSGFLSIFDVFRLHDSEFTEYQVTSLGDALYEQQTLGQTFSSRPLISILRTFIGILEKVLHVTANCTSQEDWDYEVMNPLRHAVIALLQSAERIQKQMDKQHHTIREALPTLLKEGGEGAIKICEDKLRTIFEAIDELQSAALVSVGTARSLLEKITMAGMAASVKRIENTCDDIQIKLNAVEAWITRRASDWYSHHTVMHSHLRANLYIDSNRRITEAVRKALGQVPDWSMLIVAAPPFIRMRTDLIGAHLRQPPRLSGDVVNRERQLHLVPADPVLPIIRGLLEEELGKNPSLLSNIFKAAYTKQDLQYELVPHVGWIVQALLDAGKLDQKTRNWMRVSPKISLEELKVTK